MMDASRCVRYGGGRCAEAAGHWKCSSIAAALPRQITRAWYARDRALETGRRRSAGTDASAGTCNRIPIGPPRSVAATEACRDAAKVDRTALGEQRHVHRRQIRATERRAAELRAHSLRRIGERMCDDGDVEPAHDYGA